MLGLVILVKNVKRLKRKILNNFVFMLGLSKLMLTQIIIFQFTLWKGVNKEFVLLLLLESLAKFIPIPQNLYR